MSNQSTKPNVLALILGRGGSKGLPGKNKMMLAGKPMLAWSLGHAQSAKCVTHTSVTTDCDDLKQVATQTPGVLVVDRPAELATDTASVADSARHALQDLEARLGVTLPLIVLLYANVPVRPDDLIDRAVGKLITTGCDSVQSVCPVGKAHPYWVRKLTGEGQDVIEPWEPNTIHRRQDLPPVYQLDGGLIALTRSALLTNDPANPHAFLGADRRAVVTGHGQVIDIDEPVDALVAEAVLSRGRGSGVGCQG